MMILRVEGGVWGNGELLYLRLISARDHNQRHQWTIQAGTTAVEFERLAGVEVGVSYDWGPTTIPNNALTMSNQASTCAWLDWSLTQEAIIVEQRPHEFVWVVPKMNVLTGLVLDVILHFFLRSEEPKSPATTERRNPPEHCPTTATHLVNSREQKNYFESTQSMLVLWCQRTISKLGKESPCA